MKKLNFAQFSMPDGIAGRKQTTGDVRESFADAIYNNLNGVAAKVLAEKIYKSEGEAEYNEKEVEMMRLAAGNFCQPRFADGLEKAFQRRKGPRFGREFPVEDHAELGCVVRRHRLGSPCF